VVAPSSSRHDPRDLAKGPVEEAHDRPLVGVVDDDASILRAVRRLLASAGFAVKTFISGEELLAFEHPERIDCLVLDVHLSGLSGFDLQDRFAPSHPSVPVIFITAYDDEATQERARRAGAAHYLRKPFDDHALIGAIRTSLDRG